MEQKEYNISLDDLFEFLLFNIFHNEFPKIYLGQFF